MSITVVAAAAAAKSLQSCPTLCNPIDSTPPGSAVPRILQARTLEWVAISFFNAWKWKVKVKSLSHVWLFATPWTVVCQDPPSIGFSRQEYWSGTVKLFSRVATPWDISISSIWQFQSLHIPAKYLVLFFSFWLTSLCITGSRLIHISSTNSHLFLLWLSNIPLYTRHWLLYGEEREEYYRAYIPHELKTARSMCSTSAPLAVLFRRLSRTPTKVSSGKHCQVIKIIDVLNH